MDFQEHLRTKMEQMVIHEMCQKSIYRKNYLGIIFDITTITIMLSSFPLTISSFSYFGSVAYCGVL